VLEAKTSSALALLCLMAAGGRARDGGPPIALGLLGRKCGRHRSESV